MVTDVEEIRENHERMQQFAAMCHTLKKFAGDELDLPSTPELLSMFGKVSVILVNVFNNNYHGLNLLPDVSEGGKK